MKIVALVLTLFVVVPTSALAWHVVGHYTATPPEPEVFHGSSQQIGPFRYYDFRGDQGTQIRGFGQRLGDFQYDTFRDDSGQTTTCTTQYIGDQAHTTCR